MPDDVLIKVINFKIRKKAERRSGIMNNALKTQLDRRSIFCCSTALGRDDSSSQPIMYL